VAGQTEVLGENLPQRRFVHHKSHITGPGFQTGSVREAGDETPELRHGPLLHLPAVANENTAFLLMAMFLLAAPNAPNQVPSSLSV
jgi:hypothetical protein